VVQRGEDFRFTLEAGQALRVALDGAREDLDGYFTVELGVARAIYFAHASRAKRR
jgi:hypothetical protein